MKHSSIRNGLTGAFLSCIMGSSLLLAGKTSEGKDHHGQHASITSKHRTTQNVFLRNEMSSSSTIQVTLTNTTTQQVYTLGPNQAGLQTNVAVPEGSYSVAVQTTGAFSSVQIYVGSTRVYCDATSYPGDTNSQYFLHTVNINSMTAILLKSTSCTP
jgi:hypothetical protein